MKMLYEKPVLNVQSVIQSEPVAANPWDSFTDSLESLGGSITSYEYGSGVRLGE